MGLLLYILLFIFIYCMLKVAWKFYCIYRKLHDVTKQFKNFNAQQDTKSYGTYHNTRNKAYSNTNEQTSNKEYTSSRQSTTTPTGEVIEDRRTEDEINRKIFTQEEGEYVDFEEEK